MFLRHGLRHVWNVFGEGLLRNGPVDDRFGGFLFCSRHFSRFGYHPSASAKHDQMYVLFTLQNQL